MSDGYKSKNVMLNGASQPVAASQTAQQVSNIIAVSSKDSLQFLAKIKASAVTSASGITVKLQESYDGTNWEAVGSLGQVAVTTAGWVEIKMNSDVAADAAQMPLWPLARFVVTTGVGDAVTIDEIWVSRRV